MVPHVTIGVRWVQTCPRSPGFYTSTIDGIYGEGTGRAVKAFQRACGWEQRNHVPLGAARAMPEAYFEAGGNISACRNTAESSVQFKKTFSQGRLSNEYF